jgi:hypothetical protein
MNKYRQAITINAQSIMSTTLITNVQKHIEAAETILKSEVDQDLKEALREQATLAKERLEVLELERQIRVLKERHLTYTQTNAGLIPYRHHVRTYGDGESWCRLFVFRSLDVKTLSDHDLGQACGAYESSSDVPGQRYTRRPYIKRGKFRTTVEWSGGWDI